MAAINKLTKIEIEKSDGPITLRDGGGLTLVKSKSGKASWIFRFRFNGKRPEVGLGSYPEICATAARAKAAQARQWLEETPQRDPRVEWANATAVVQKPKNEPRTFGEFVEAELPRVTSGLSNAKHKAQWGSSMRTYCQPIWHLPIDEVGGDEVAMCLEPHWTSKNETMRRVRARMENFLGSAKQKGHRDGDNPAAWSVQQHYMPKLTRDERRVKHHATHHYDDMPDFWDALSKRPANSARAFQFALLTASRSQEVRGARWSEFDFDERVWTVPETRMKAGLEHKVPLSNAAIELLNIMPRNGEVVFYNDVRGGQLGENGMRALLLRMGDAAINREGRMVTQHGCCRSAFKDWAGDKTAFDDQTSEFALAHVGDALFRSYRHKTALDKRRQLMQAWADYLTRNEASNVLPLVVGG